MERYRKGAVYTLVLFYLIATVVLITELPMLAPHLRILYAVSKLTIMTSLLGIAYWLHRDINSQPANTAAGVLLMIYCCHGQLFRPTYYFALLQSLVIYSFIFPISKIRFRIIAGCGCLAFTAVLYFTWDHFQKIGASAQFSDICLVIVGVAVIGFICNTFFSAERSVREDYIQRFGQIGIQTARTVHDLKGLISAPKLYVQLLESKYATHVDREAAEIIGLLARDLESLQGVLKELNQLSILSPIDAGPVRVSDVITSIQMLLQKQLIGIDIVCDTEKSVLLPLPILTSIFLNLIQNSVQASSSQSGASKKIRVSSLNETFIVVDNAGGFDSQVLNNLKRRSFAHHQSESGLGLLFVTDEMNKIGGTIQFSNALDGAEVQLKFPSKLVRH